MNNTILIKKKQLKESANWMKVEHPAELPEVRQGIFFMDGNVLPDDCLTMYRSDWNADQLTLLLRVFDPVIWTFHSSMGGRMLVYLVKFSRFTYLFRFSDATLQHGHITPIVFGWSVPQHSSQVKDVWQMSRGFEKRLQKKLVRTSLLFRKGGND